MQNSLFEEALTPAFSTALELTTLSSVGMSKLQKDFKQWVESIEALQQRMVEIDKLAVQHRSAEDAVMRPLRNECLAAKRAMALFLDVRLLQKGLSKNQRAFLAEFTCNLAVDLMHSAYGDGMEAVYERHSEVDLLESRQQAKEAIKATMQSNFGDLFDDESFDEPAFEADPPEVFMQKMMAKMREKIQASAEFEVPLEKPKKKPSAKQAEKLAKEQQQDIDASALLKALYRKLSSALHPDRELDPDERIRKTALMSQANAAYDSKDLLKLLHIQRQAQNMGSQVATELADDKLKQMNAMLKAQYNDLCRKVRLAEDEVRHEFGLGYGATISTASLSAELRSDAAEARGMLSDMQNDLRNISHNDTHLKLWLKTLQRGY